MSTRLLALAAATLSTGAVRAEEPAAALGELSVIAKARPMPCSAGETLSQIGRTIPGNSAHQGLARLGYDQPVGPFAGLEGDVESVVLSDFLLDSADLLKAPGDGLVNVHSGRTLGGSPAEGGARRIDGDVEVRNALGRPFIGSSQTRATTFTATGRQNGAAALAATPGSIDAGAPAWWWAG